MAKTNNVIAQLGETKESLATVVNNARTRVRNVRRIVRTRNADGEIEETVVEEPATVDAGTAADIPDDAVIPVSEIIEVIEESAVAPSEIDTEEIVEEVPADDVQNVRRYRRIKNARIIRSANGRCDVVVPAEEAPRRKTANRRYVRRVVSSNAGYKLLYPDAIIAQPTDEMGYIEIVPASDPSGFNTPAKLNNYRVVHRAVAQNVTGGTGTNLDQTKQDLKEIKDTLESLKNGRSYRTRNASGRMRFRNYRTIRNEDGTMEIEIEVKDALPPDGDSGADFDDAPVDVTVVVDGVEVASSEDTESNNDESKSTENRRRALRNARIVAARNRRNMRAARNRRTETHVHNASTSAPALDIPSTFPTTEK